MTQKKPVRENIEKIAKELEKAGATKWDCAKIIKELQNIHLPEKKLKKKAAELLKQSNPKAAETFISFQKMKVFTSKEKLEQFNRGNITKSLLKETKASPAIAEKISSDVEDWLKSLGTSAFTTSMIRDMVCAKLIELGQTKTYFQYARLGMPVFDISEKISDNATPKELLRQFNWIKAVPQKAKELHFAGKIKIIAPEDFSSRPFALHSTANLANQAANENFFWIQEQFLKSLESCTQSPSINGLNILLAKSLEKKTKTGINQSAADAVSQLDLLYSIKKSIFLPAVGISLFVSSETDIPRKQKEKALEFGVSFLKTAVLAKPKNFLPAVSISSKYELKLLKGISGKIMPVNCFDGENAAFAENMASKKTLIGQAVAINLERFYEKKEENALEKTIQACRAVQEAITEKEKITQSKDAENFVFLENFSEFVSKQAAETKDALEEIKKCFKENTVLFAGKKPGQKKGDRTALDSGMQAAYVAEGTDEVESLFVKKARTCILSN